MNEHAHIWQWNGYHFTMEHGQGVLHWRCQGCGKRKEEPVIMTDWWYEQAYTIWDYSQKHPVPEFPPGELKRQVQANSEQER